MTRLRALSKPNPPWWVYPAALGIMLAITAAALYGWGYTAYRTAAAHDQELAALRAQLDVDAVLLDGYANALDQAEAQLREANAK
jgi:folate-dependent phosphoribosylglycinamide formyltransferase PurN